MLVLIILTNTYLEYYSKIRLKEFVASKTFSPTVILQKNDEENYIFKERNDFTKKYPCIFSTK